MLKNAGSLKKVLSLVLAFSFLFTQCGFAQMATELNLAGRLGAFSRGPVTENLRLPHLRYFSFDHSLGQAKFLLDKGDLKGSKPGIVQASGEELLKYFLIGVTLPDENFWVNLRPDFPEQIISDSLAKTDMGKVLLEADLQLKKDTARLTSPETPTGKLYWEKLYQKANELFGSAPANIPTLTRPWIVPGEIVIRESANSAYIYKATLKVMLEQDHLKDSGVYNFTDPRLKSLNEYSAQLIREMIIPQLTKEVNNAQRYAALKQVYYSLILSRWFKNKFRGKSGLYASRIDTADLQGLNSHQEWSRQTYFKQYQESFNKGEYNLKTPANTVSGTVIRSYFSGGFNAVTIPYANGFSGKADLEKAAIKAGLEPFLPGSSSPLSVAAVKETRQENKLELLAKNAQALKQRIAYLQSPGIIKDRMAEAIGKIKAELGKIEIYNEHGQKSYINSRLRPSLQQLAKGKRVVTNHKVFARVNDYGEENTGTSRAVDVGLDFNLERSPSGIAIEAYLLVDSGFDNVQSLHKYVIVEFDRGRIASLQAKLKTVEGRIESAKQSLAKLDSRGSSSPVPENSFWDTGDTLQDKLDYNSRVIAKFNVKLAELAHKVKALEKKNGHLKIKLASRDALETRQEIYHLEMELTPLKEEVARITQVIGQYKQWSAELELKIAEQDKDQVSHPKNSSSPVDNALGGIDFRALPMACQPLGSFYGLNLSLAAMKNLEKIDTAEELQAIEKMVEKGLLPSGERVKELVAACYQKKELGRSQEALMLCLMRICKLAEDSVGDLDQGTKESLVIVDSF